jgi:hypothetical protein
MSEGVSGLRLEDHFSALEHRSFRNQDHGIVAGVFLSVRNQQLGEALDIELVFRDYAAVRGSSHGRQHGGEPGIAAEDFEHQESFMRACAGAEAVGHRYGSGHARTEADTVVRAGNIIVHGLGDGDHLHTFLI